MNIVNQTITIDLQRPEINVIHAKQDDSLTRTLTINLRAGGTAWEPGSEVKYAVQYRKPDGKRGLYERLPDGETKAVITSGSALAVTLAPQVFTVAGRVYCSVVMFTDNGKKLQTFSFIVDVEASEVPDGIASEDYYKFTSLNSLRAALGELDELRTKDHSSLVAAINELLESIGDTANLTTQDKEIVAAINELVGRLDMLGDEQSTAILGQIAGVLKNISEGDICGVPYFDNLSTEETGQFGVLNILRTEEEENEPGFVEVPSAGTVKEMSAAVNVKYYGAAGDGVVDDTEALRRARATAIRLNKALYLPAGTYLVHGSIELWSGCEIYGEGSRTVIKKIAAVSEVLKAPGTAGSFTAGQNVFAVADASKYTLGHDCFVGLNWQNSDAGLYGKISAIDRKNNTVTVAAYPKGKVSGALKTGLDGDDYGVMNFPNFTAVFSSSFPVLCAHKYTPEGGLNALHDVYLHDFVIDGNRQEDEAKPYYLSAIHFDDLENVKTDTEITVAQPHENIRVDRVTVRNSPADGISVQSGKNVCINDVFTENCGYNGVHLGVGTVGTSVNGCKLNADFCGYFDCNGVSSVSLSGNHFEGCLTGVGGLDTRTRGLTVQGNTFRGCGVGVRAGSQPQPENMLEEYPNDTYMGTPDTGITISGNTFYGVGMEGKGISFAKGYHFAVSGNTFRDLETAMELGGSSHINISGNLIKDCKAPLAMKDTVLDDKGNTVAAVTTNSAFTGNVIVAEAEGASAKLEIQHAENMLVSGNILTGTDAAVNVDENTTSGIITENNIVPAEVAA